MSRKTRAVDIGWPAMFAKYNIGGHDFSKSPFYISVEKIKAACRHLPDTSAREVRTLCYQPTRKARPQIFAEHGLFLLPTDNQKEYVIIQGEGYVDIPPIDSAPVKYTSQLDFRLRAAEVGNSEAQHLDYAYAVSMVRNFVGDDSLVPVIRGRKYTPPFEFKAGGFNIAAKSIQTEVDIGYEGRGQIVLVEAKNSKTQNTIIRQLYYPFRQWEIQTGKPVRSLFFEKQGGEYHFWEFGFADKNDYNSIRLRESARYTVAP